MGDSFRFDMIRIISIIINNIIIIDIKKEKKIYFFFSNIEITFAVI